MGLWQLTTSRSLRSRAWTLAPVLAVAAVIAAAPCDCPDHTGSHRAPQALAQAAMPGMHHGMAPAGHDGSGLAAADHDADDMAFEVGTTARPLVTRSASGPLWKSSKQSAPGATKHGSYAEQTVGAQLARLRDPAALANANASGSGSGDEPVAERAALLTTAQATKKLSRRCQQLIKRRKGSLRKTDRKRRDTCLAQRRKLVQASKTPASAPGVTAPAAPIQGPAPTAAPPAAPATGAGTETEKPAATTPSPTTPAEPREKTYAAAGVIATDGLDPFKLTRGTATADVVNFELDNTDRQEHDLYIAPASASGEVSGPLVKVIGRIDGGTRKSADVELAPGRYKLICTVDGHAKMAVNFMVYAP